VTWVTNRAVESGGPSAVRFVVPSTDRPATESRLRALFPALADAAPASLARIVERGIPRRIAAGAIVFDAHTPCGGFPLVLSGTIKVLQRYPNGRELPLYRVKPGESCLLSGSCLLGHIDYTASGLAETDVELLVLPPADFHALIATDEAFRNHVFAMFGERLATLMSLVEAIAYQKLDQRLAALLLAKGDPVRATHQSLADELGSVREIVSRLLRVFEDRGFVDLARERIRIVDRAALAALADA
jgi:CRP/FNR family transcriptional regulator